MLIKGDLRGRPARSDPKPVRCLVLGNSYRGESPASFTVDRTDACDVRDKSTLHECVDVTARPTGFIFAAWSGPSERVGQALWRRSSRSTASTSRSRRARCGACSAPTARARATLLRMLFGLIHPDAGTVELLGRPFAGTASAALKEVGGFVEEPAFYPYLSGRANLSLLARLDGEPGGDGGRGRRSSGARARRPRSGGAMTASAATRPGCASASGSRPRSCARRGCCCWTSRRAGSTRPGRARSRRWCASWPPRASRCCSPATRSGSSSGLCDAYTVMREGRVVWDGIGGGARRAGAGVGVRARDQRRRAGVADRRGQAGVRARRSTAGRSR